MAQDSGEVEQIKAEIEETRAGMSETIDEIQERLRPANLARQAGESIRAATVARAEDLTERASEVAGEIRERPGDVGVAAMRLVSENPAVAAVIGIFATVMGVCERSSRVESEPDISSPGAAASGRVGTVAGLRS